MKLRVLGLLLLQFSVTMPLIASDKLNVLFIAVDDLRPELGCYGAPIVQSPNIDALAQRSLLFENAHCQYPLCNPSRASIMTGLRPATTMVFDLKKHFRETNPDFVTIPQLFKKNGWYTASVGKIFHGIAGPMGDLESWSQPPQAGVDQAPDPDGNPRKSHGLPWEAPDVSDDKLPDGDIANKAIKVLQENKDRPFFLAVGFAKPHLPFVAPKKYWDKYESTSVTLAANQTLPDGSPTFITNNAGELRQYIGIPKTGPIPNDQQYSLKQGYLACVSFMDAQLGKVLSELDKLKLRDKTVIVFWGDHGYQLGEHGTWTKHTVWEDSIRVPLLLSSPDGRGAGKRTTAPVELVDVFPTLTDLCKLEPPANLEGLSLVPLLTNPGKPIKAVAFSSFRKNVPELGNSIGVTMRTERYRFTEWKPVKRTENSKPFYYELYDHQNDAGENVNLANSPEHKELVENLKQKLRAGWKASKPTQ